MLGLVGGGRRSAGAGSGGAVAVGPWWPGDGATGDHMVPADLCIWSCGAFACIMPPTSN